LRRGTVARQAGDLRPALHEAVVRKRFLRTLLALAHRVEPIGQLAGNLSLLPIFATSSAAAFSPPASNARTR
jgi:hypothetical protein